MRDGDAGWRATVGDLDHARAHRFVSHDRWCADELGLMVAPEVMVERLSRTSVGSCERGSRLAAEFNLTATVLRTPPILPATPRPLMRWRRSPPAGPAGRRSRGLPAQRVSASSAKKLGNPS